jgi:predicted nucleotidyltransferase
MENFIWKKGRKREYYGKLTDFESLDTRVQDKFKEIKLEVLKEFGEDTNVYVYGSHYWGYADKNSDYDVRIDKGSMNFLSISEKISDIIGVDTHIMFVKEKRLDGKGIIIP